MKFKSLYICCVALFLALAALPVTSAEDKVSTHEEWVEMVEQELESLRVSRSIPEEANIVDLSEHYRLAFKAINDQASIEEEYEPRQREMTREMPVAGRYIVFMEESSEDEDLDKILRVLKKANIKSNGRFIANHISPVRFIGKGFTATLSPSVVNVLKKHPKSYSVENDVVIKRNSHHMVREDIEDLEEVITAQEDKTVNEESNAKKQSVEWNLDRIDQRSAELDGSYNPKGTGHGVDVYVLDTGIRYSHHEFNGRAKYSGYDAIDALLSSSSPKNGLDCNGHGTHCAATIGGRVFGVAKSVNLYSGRVLDCSGTGSITGILHSMEHIIKARHAAGKDKRTAVMSMSLGVKKSEGFNKAVDNTVKSGIVVVSASGNQRGDSCNYSPGSASLSIAVAASSRDDQSTSFSNIGSCTDIYAPGNDILSAGSSCDSCTARKSGTSMACPHVAGYVAILLVKNPTMSPAKVEEKMISDSTKDTVKMGGSSTRLASLTPNRFLYVGK